MNESGILKCAPCIAYRADQANDAWTIAGGQALCKEHLVVLEIHGGGRSLQPFSNHEKETETP